MQLTSELLNDLYVQQGLSTLEIGSRLGLWSGRIHRELVKFGIPTRSKKQAATTGKFLARCSARNAGEMNPNYGKTASPSTRKKIAKKLTGNTNSYKTGRCMDGRGYVLVHSTGRKFSRANYYLEHRLVMEAALGRVLLRSEVVHHINEDRTDNRIENLMLFASNEEHLAHHRRLAALPDDTDAKERDLVTREWLRFQAGEIWSAETMDDAVDTLADTLTGFGVAVEDGKVSPPRRNIKGGSR